MRAEVLCIGTELLLGDTVNTNAAYISSRLSELGIDCFYHSVAGDNPERIQSAIGTALNRVDLLIITGGLGPTDDDITMQAVADYFNTKLVFHAEPYKLIEKFFRSRNREVPEKAKKQAYLPEGAEVVFNPVGTAPGGIWNIQDKTVVVLPGVPEELYAMWEGTIEKYLSQYSEFTITKRFLKFFDIPEGSLGEEIKDLMESPNPTVAPLVAEGQPNIRIAAKAKSAAEAEAMINIIENKILDRIGKFYWGRDGDTIEEVVGNMLSAKNMTLSVAESCTGGLISSMLTDVSGCSSYIKLNLITYSNETKINTLGVNAALIEKYGAVSEPVAKEMAEGIRKLVGTGYGLGITGIAGPTGGTYEKPVGLVYIGISDGNRTKVHKVNINSAFPRKLIKQRSSMYALQFLRQFIKKAD